MKIEIMVPVKISIPDENLVCPSCIALAEKAKQLEIDKPCFNCGNPAKENHHVVPRSLGGIATVPLCHECHGLVHAIQNRTGQMDLCRSGREAKRKIGGDLGGTVKPWQKRIGRGKDAKLVDDMETIARIKQVKTLLGKGKKYRQIADEVGISPGTISNWKSQLDDENSEMNAALTAAR